MATSEAKRYYSRSSLGSWSVSVPVKFRRWKMKSTSAKLPLLAKAKGGLGPSALVASSASKASVAAKSPLVLFGGMFFLSSLRFPDLRLRVTMTCKDHERTFSWSLFRWSMGDPRRVQDHYPLAILCSSPDILLFGISSILLFTCERCAEGEERNLQLELMARLGKSGYLKSFDLSIS